MVGRRVRLTPPVPELRPGRPVIENTREEELYSRLGEGPFLIQGYDVSNLPDAPTWGLATSADPFSSLIFVYDESGGPVIAFSDGTNWRRVTDRAIVS